MFSKQGKVVEARVVYDRESGRSRGFGFVTYCSAIGLTNAIESLNGVVSKSSLFICDAILSDVSLYVSTIHESQDTSRSLVKITD